MRRDSHWLHFIVLLTLAAATLACNLPGAQLSPAQPPATQTASRSTPEASKPTQPPATQTASRSTPEGNKPTQPPSAQPLKTESALVTMEGGRGYIFSTRVITQDDRDIWWNSEELVPDTGRMISLGAIASLAQVKELAFPAQTPSTFIPKAGEGFGMEIKRDAKTTYAVMRIVKLENRIITFEWVYPFTGTIK